MTFDAPLTKTFPLFPFRSICDYMVNDVTLSGSFIRNSDLQFQRQSDSNRLTQE